MALVIRITLIVVIATLALGSADAFAAGRGKRGGGEAGAQNAQKQKASKEAESAYQNALKSIPNGKPNADPWAGAR